MIYSIVCIRCGSVRSKVVKVIRGNGVTFLQVAPAKEYVSGNRGIKSGIVNGLTVLQLNSNRAINFIPVHKVYFVGVSAIVDLQNVLTLTKSDIIGKLRVNLESGCVLFIIS